MTVNKINLCPQPGPQTAFLSTKANIAIYGGAAGGGKTYALILESLRHLHNPNFNVVFFRRETPQITNPGALWDELSKIYKLFGAVPRSGKLDWKFPQGLYVKCAHLQLEETKENFQGSQISAIFFDELCHFTEGQFFYMFSRNRSISGVPGYIRATCNPDARSWVRQFIDWWIDDNGYAIPERSGVVRWLIRLDESIIWGDSCEELINKYGSIDEFGRQTVTPRSVTFIPSKLTDNRILMENQPEYLAGLRAMSRVDRMRLLDGNWNVVESAGLLFRKEWFPIVEAVPAGWTTAARFWDRAGTRPNETNKDPDWTRGLLLYKYPDNSFLIADLRSMRDTPGQVENLIKNVASHDGWEVAIVSLQDPGSAGVLEANNFVRMLAGYNVRTVHTSKDKVTRARPVSAQAEVGNVRVLRAPWNKELFDELENFPDGNHDDIVDTLSGAFDYLATGISILDAF